MQLPESPAALSAPGKLLSAIVDSSDDAILSKSLDGTITSWNKGAERIFGYTAEEIVGKSILALVPASRQTDQPDLLARIMRGERIAHYESERIRKDGSLVPMSLSLSPVRSEDDTIIGVSIVARDITAQQEAIRASALLAAIVEFSDDAIISKRLDGVITSWNKAAQRIFGYTSEEIVGKSVLTLIPPELQAEEPDILARLSRGERNVTPFCP